MPSVANLNTTWESLWNKRTDGTPVVYGTDVISLVTTSITAVTSNSVVAVLNELQSDSLEAGSTYSFKAVVSFSCSITGSANISISGNVTPTYITYNTAFNTGLGAGSTSPTTGTFNALDGIYVGAASGGGMYIINGTIKVATSGRLSVKAAQAIPTSGTTNFLRGSTLYVEKIPAP